jgi:hypothetical protein
MANESVAFKAENRNAIPTSYVVGAEATAPSAGATLADTGALAAGTYRFVVSWATTDTAANLIQIAHRNAANGADVEVSDFASGVLAGGCPGGWAEAIMTLAANERVRVRNKNAGTSALFYQATIYVFLLS